MLLPALGSVVPPGQTLSVTKVVYQFTESRRIDYMKELAGGGRNDVVYAWDELVDGCQRCLRVYLLCGYGRVGCLGGETGDRAQHHKDG